METNYFKEGYAIKDQFATHFLTLTICGWIDLFTRKCYKDIIIEALKYAQQQNQLIIYAYVIMSNHLHIIARADDKQKKTLSDIIRDFKKFTHHRFMEIIESEVESRKQWMLHQFNYYGKHNSNNERMQIWTNDNHPEECFTSAFTNSKLDYIHQNPVRAGVVMNAEDYMYSSASNYAGKKGILDVEVL